MYTQFHLYIVWRIWQLIQMKSYLYHLDKVNCHHKVVKIVTISFKKKKKKKDCHYLLSCGCGHRCWNIHRLPGLKTNPISPVIQAYPKTWTFVTFSLGLDLSFIQQAQVAGLCWKQCFPIPFGGRNFREDEKLDK